MNATELQKILKAGFTAIDVRNESMPNRPAKLTIWQKSPQQREWHKHDKTEYPTKAACKRAFAKLLEDEKTIDLFDCLHNQL